MPKPELRYTPEVLDDGRIFIGSRAINGGIYLLTPPAPEGSGGTPRYVGNHIGTGGAEYPIGGDLDRETNTLYTGASEPDMVIAYQPGTSSLSQPWRCPSQPSQPCPYTTDLADTDRQKPVLSSDKSTVYQSNRGGGTLHAINAVDGSQKWTFATCRTLSWATGAVHPGGGAVPPLVFVGATDGNFYALKQDNDEDRDNDGDIDADDRVYWRVRTPVDTLWKSTAVVHPDGATVYIGDDEGTFYGIDVATGLMRWAYDTKRSLADNSANPPAGLDQDDDPMERGDCFP
jgi:outer membrane protein assembly factor BamB